MQTIGYKLGEKSYIYGCSGQFLTKKINQIRNELVTPIYINIYK